MGRATVDQVRQLGVETTAGTETDANRKLTALSINLTPQVDKDEFRAAGYKGMTASSVNGLWATGGYEGPVDYNHIIYPLEGLVGSPGPTGATLAKTRVFTPASSGPDSNAKTYTADAGDSAAARVYTRVRFRSFQLEVARRTGSRNTGNLYSNFPVDGQTLTASPTVIAQKPVGALEWDIYADDTFGAIGTTKVTDAYAAGFAVGDKFNPFWRLNSTDAGKMGDEAEVPHEITGRIVTMHNAQSRGIFATLSANPVKYLRFVALGPIIEAAVRYTIQLDFAAQFANPDDDDNEGIFGVAYNLRSIYDASLGGHWKLTNISTVATL